MNHKAEWAKALLFSCCWLLAGTAWAVDEGEQHELVFDARLDPHPKNRNVDTTSFNPVAGDTLVLKVDPTVLYRTENSQRGHFIFTQNEAPPELRGFYVIKAFSDEIREVDKDGNLKEIKLSCEKKDQDVNWPRSNGVNPYLCEDPERGSLKKLIESGIERVCVVETPPQPPQPPQPTQTVSQCLGGMVKRENNGELTGKLTLIGEVEMVSAVVEHAEGTKERYEFSKVNDRFVAQVPLKAGLVSVKLSLKRKQRANEERKSIPTFRVSARDTHSLVRIQAGVVTTNRVRSVSFVVAVTPVLRAFFEQDGGPWRSKRCHVLCTVSPTMLLRLSDDSKGPVQLGLGLTVFMVRSFHLNTGFLFGTGDISTGWQAERSWFVGVGIDPALLADAKSLKF